MTLSGFVRARALAHPALSLDQAAAAVLIAAAAAAALAAALASASRRSVAAAVVTSVTLRVVEVNHGLTSLDSLEHCCLS